MRFAEDDRARVPFALVGVVLLVGSATAAAALASYDPAPTDTRADVAADRTLAGAETALAGAARAAAANAVREPVVSGANAEFGAAIDQNSPFRDALALRVYARTERALRDHHSTVGAATAAVSLPRIETPPDAERAIDAVVIEPVGESSVRVTVSGVRLVVRRNGDAVTRSQTNVTTTVHTPALALHDRVTGFERRLDRNAIEGPGLDRRLTDYLHRVVWLRGPLQFAGLPISNVLANRHVELMTNRALLGVQRSTFGRVDATSEAAYARAYARVGLDDVRAVVQGDAERRATDVLQRTGVPEPAGKIGVEAGIEAIGGPAQSVPVGVNVTADRAFLQFVDSGGDTSLDGTLRAAFTTIATRQVDVSVVGRSTTRSGTRPENWTLADSTDHRDVVVDGDAAPGPLLGPAKRQVLTDARRVVVTDRETRTYVDGGRQRRVVETTRTAYRVSVGVGYEVRPTPGELPGAAQDVLDADVADVEPAIHDRIAATATRALVASEGGIDELVRRAVDGETLGREQLIRPALPESVRNRAYRAAADLRREARLVSVNVSTTELTGGRVPTATLRDRVDALHDPRESYDTVTDRAVDAVRETYLGRVVERLQDRPVDGALGDVGEALGKRGFDEPLPIHRSVADEGVIAEVDGAPAYLTLGRVGPDAVEAVEEPYYPLAARNVNWFTVPHGDAAAAVVDGALPERPKAARLGTAAQALAAANDTLTATDNRTLAAKRAELRSAVRESVASAARDYRGVLAASTLSLTDHERNLATHEAFSQWPTVAARASAVANGSAAAAIADTATRIADVTPRQRDRLETRLRAATPELVDRDSVRVDAELVQRTVDATRTVGHAVAETLLSEVGSVAAERAAKQLGAADVGAVPAGLPLAPVPGYWYATTNAWSVSVGGSWARFTVRAEGGSPVGPGDGAAYVREDATVAFDVDGDGERERVGRNERLSFDVKATVGVVVPAGPRGVGDVDGDADEQSPGW